MASRGSQRAVRLTKAPLDDRRGKDFDALDGFVNRRQRMYRIPDEGGAERWIQVTEIKG